jgi:predicted DNA-binding transcriptional regulator AlpA
MTARLTLPKPWRIEGLCSCWPHENVCAWQKTEKKY